MHQSDPEWAPFFMNYKFLKKKIKEIKVGERRGGCVAYMRGPAINRAGYRPTAGRRPSEMLFILFGCASSTSS